MAPEGSSLEWSLITHDGSGSVCHISMVSHLPSTKTPVLLAFGYHTYGSYGILIRKIAPWHREVDIIQPDSVFIVPSFFRWSPRATAISCLDPMGNRNSLHHFYHFYIGSWKKNTTSNLSSWRSGQWSVPWIPDVAPGGSWSGQVRTFSPVQTDSPGVRGFSGSKGE